MFVDDIFEDYYSKDAKEDRYYQNKMVEDYIDMCNNIKPEPLKDYYNIREEVNKSIKC